MYFGKHSISFTSGTSTSWIMTDLLQLDPYQLPYWHPCSSLKLLHFAQPLHLV